MPLNYNKKTPIFTNSTTAPAVKQIDDLWLEATGTARSPMLWRWDGAYWRSNAMKWNGSQNDTTSAMKLFLQLEPFHAFYLRSLAVSHFSSTATTTTSYWGYELFFSITGFNKIGGNQFDFYWDNWGANIPGSSSVLFDKYINLTTREANFLCFAANRVGSAPNATMAFTLTYELIRK